MIARGWPSNLIGRAAESAAGSANLAGGVALVHQFG
jgi:hypothetical protein